MTFETLVTSLKTVSGGLFDIAGETIEFVTSNPICLTGMILWLFVAGAGIVRSFVKGV